MDKLFKFAQNYLTNVKAWLLALASNLWEDYLKDKLHEQIHSLVERGVALVQEYHVSEEYVQKREMVLDYIFKTIELPFFLKPFKGLIRAILTSNIEKQVDKIMNKLDELTEK